MNDKKILTTSVCVENGSRNLQLILVCRWTPHCRSWMNLSQRLWLPVLLHTSPRTNDRRNWLTAKVKVKKRSSVLWQISFNLFYYVMCASAVSLEPYGLSLPISISSCSITDRQSPTLLSMSSGLSGNSTDRSHKGGYVNADFLPAQSRSTRGIFKALWCISLFFRSTSLNLDGVRRLWGKDGYLVKREPVEEAGQVEVPNSHVSLSPEAAVSPSQTPTSKASPELEPEKQQLASSLFIGLASHSSVSLVRILKSQASCGSWLSFCTYY